MRRLSVFAAAVHRLLMFWSTGSKMCGFSVVMAPGLQSSRSVVVAHGHSCSKASSWTWDGTRAPYIGRHIPLYHQGNPQHYLILLQKNEKQAGNNIQKIYSNQNKNTCIYK